MSKVFIIGNGFDIDLGWKTGYKSFVNSHFWPLWDKTPNCTLASYLEEKTNIDRWYDLEGILRDYASPSSSFGNTPVDPNDYAFFERLKLSLSEYLKKEEQKGVDNNSLAIQVLRAVINNGYFSSVYSFNYTDLRAIAQKARIGGRIDYESVHGKVADNSLILGIDDKSEVRRGGSFFRKVFSEKYTSHSIRYDLQDCDEVVFFGHSLGDIDYPYFEDFFEAQSRCPSRSYGKSITIFTKNNESRIQILEQLRYMTAAHTERLRNDNQFNIIMTDYPDPVLLTNFFNHLKDDSIRVYGSML